MIAAASVSVVTSDCDRTAGSRPWPVAAHWDAVGTLATMHAVRCNLRRSTWLALVATLAMAIMPALAHALAHARGGSNVWAEVCTPQGMKLVDLDRSTTDAGIPASSAANVMGHCPCCTFSAGIAVLPVSPVATQALSAGADTVPALSLHAPRTIFAWASAQPRAPPPLS